MAPEHLPAMCDMTSVDVMVDGESICLDLWDSENHDMGMRRPSMVASLL